MKFELIKTAVAKQFNEMTGTQNLFRTEVEGDKLWEMYLASFPPGTNPIFRERTEHDCSCCKSFIRNIGGVVSIKDGKVSTIWDVQVDDPTYQLVADNMGVLVRNSNITGIYRHYEKTVGTDKNFEQAIGAEPIRWDHFFVNLPTWAVVKKDKIGPVCGDARATYDVMLRGLTEIQLQDIHTVMELIAQGSLYRGDEHKFAVTEFCKLKVRFLNTLRTSQFVWENYAALPQSVSRIRNTAIGTLLVDLSNGVDLEDAVKSFESKVAPTNYKRPTALVTAAMINKAKETITGLGLTSALERRFATIQDITINNVLFADRSAKKAMGDGLFDDLQPTAGFPKKLDKVEEVSMGDFIQNILPKIDSIEVMVENRLAPNFVSLIAPTDPTSGQLFKWDNRFSWSYSGEVADSIKERVKAAGGAVDGDLCCRLAWNNTDDLDFHMVEPNGALIYYGCRRQTSMNGGMLDLDANGADGMRADPAENIVYADRKRMRSGTYKLVVHQFSKRNTSSVGFEVEIEADGQKVNVVYDKAVPQSTKIHVADIHYNAVTKEFKIEPALPSTQSSKVVWGLPTQQFHRVSVVMTSPNFWDDLAVGNKHWFFMLDGCINDGRARGFYNEFLKSELDQHRKVLELVGSRTPVKDTPHQLSGLGFSSTQRNNLICRVKGSFTRTISITI